jgi:hypothetical protein
LEQNKDIKASTKKEDTVWNRIRTLHEMKEWAFTALDNGHYGIHKLTIPSILRRALAPA